MSMEYGNLLVQGALSSPKMVVGYTQQISGSGQVPIISGGSYQMPYPLGALGTGPVVVNVGGQNVLGWGQTGIGSGYSGFSGFSGSSISISGSGYSGFSGISGYSGNSGFSGSSGVGISGFSGLGLSGFSGFSGTSGFSGIIGLSGFSGISGFSGSNGSASIGPGTTNEVAIWSSTSAITGSSYLVFTPGTSSNALWNIPLGLSAMPTCQVVSVTPVNQLTGGYSVGNTFTVPANSGTITQAVLQITGVVSNVVTSISVISGGLYTDPLQTFFYVGSGLAFYLTYSAFVFTGAVIIGDGLNQRTNTAIGNGQIFTNNIHSTGSVITSGGLTVYNGNLSVTSAGSNSPSFTSLTGNSQLTLNGGLNSTNGIIFTSNGGNFNEVSNQFPVFSIISTNNNPFSFIDNLNNWTPINYIGGPPNTGHIIFAATTPSTSIGTGAVLISGGIAIDGNIALGTLNPVNAGNALTWNAQGVLVDSGHTPGGSGGSTITISATDIAYATATNTVGGSALFTYNNTGTNTGYITLWNTTPSNNLTSGALIISGGAAVGGNLNIGGDLVVSGFNSYVNCASGNDTVNIIGSMQFGHVPTLTSGTVGIGNTTYWPSYSLLMTSAGDTSLSSSRYTYLYAQNTNILSLTNTSATWSSGITSLFQGAITSSGILTIGNTTPTTNMGTGAVLISGGMAVVGASNIGAISTTFNGNVIAGVQSGTSAISGQVGEVSVTSVSGATSITSNATYQQLASINVPAGDWEIFGFVTIIGNGSTITTTANSIICLNQITASSAGTTEGLGDIGYISQVFNATSGKDSIMLHKSVNQGSASVWYLNVQSSFSGADPQAVGSISYRRAR